MSGGNNCSDVVTQDEISEILKNNVGGKFRLLGCNVRPASENPTGFLGEHYRLEAEIKMVNRTKKMHYFIKRIPMKVPEHREYAIKTRAFYKEVELYKTLIQDLKNAQRDVADRTKWCAECYYSRGSELFVLEDLTAQCYYMFPERCFMDEEHIKVSLKAIAAMHAASFVFEEKFNDGKVPTLSPDFKSLPGVKATIGEIYPNLTFETEASDVKGHPGNSYHEAGIGSQVKIIDFITGYTEREKQIIREKLPDVMRYSLQLVKSSERFKNVLSHGDLWANNILFRKDGKGKVKEAVLVDYQLARYTPPAQDVTMFLHLVQSKKFRQDNRERLLEYYYAAFNDELKKNGLSAEALLPWKVFLQSCDFYDDLGLLTKLFYFQLILAPAHITSRFLSSPEIFTKNMLVDRTDMVVECFLNDDIYQSRVTEALNEVVTRFILQ